MAAPVWTAPTDRAESISPLRKAVELGGNFFDTADAYALGESEELLGEALRPYGDEVAVATKVGNLRPSPTEWIPLGHPAYPLADQIGALKQLQDEGKVRHIGLWEVTVAELLEAERTAPIAAVQNLYNLAEDQFEQIG